MPSSSRVAGWRGCGGVEVESRHKTTEPTVENSENASQMGEIAFLALWGVVPKQPASLAEFQGFVSHSGESVSKAL